jgi:hypothetical protein
MEFDKKGIALGSTTEDRKFRKKFIVDFYVKWNMAIPTKHIYNKSLNSFIEVRFLSINETARIASYKIYFHIGSYIINRNFGKCTTN